MLSTTPFTITWPERMTNFVARLGGGKTRPLQKGSKVYFWFSGITTCSTNGFFIISQPVLSFIGSERQDKVEVTL